MAVNLRGRCFLKLVDFNQRELRYLLDLSRDLTDEFHPTQMLADLHTMREHADKTPSRPSLWRRSGVEPCA